MKQSTTDTPFVRYRVALLKHIVAIGSLILVAGCGNLGTQPGPLFFAPLSIDDETVGSAVIDTGGGFEVMLRERFGLDVVGELDVLRFGGREIVEITEPFSYTAGGFGATADFAILQLSVCDCNGIGVQFFRKTGVVLGLNFDDGSAEFHATAPRGGVTLTFEPSPPGMGEFDTAFTNIVVQSGEETVELVGLFDTGTNSTLLRRSLIGAPSGILGDRSEVYMTHERLGTLLVNARLFDTPGLPDVILGTDAMKAWGPQWYFSFANEGGTVTVFPPEASRQMQDINQQ